jgi:hypothetical protein
MIGLSLSLCIRDIILGSTVRINAGAEGLHTRMGDFLVIENAAFVARMARIVEADVTKIITMTCARTEAEWDKLIITTCARTKADCDKLHDQYWRIYWSKVSSPIGLSASFNPATAIEMVQRLRAQGKIEQPKLDNPEYNHSVHDGHWIDCRNA